MLDCICTSYTHAIFLGSDAQCVVEVHNKVSRIENVSLHKSNANKDRSLGFERLVRN